MKKLALTILLTGAVSFGVCAQTDNSALKNLQAEAKGFKHKKRYVIQYDENAGQTNVFFHYATFKGVEEDADDPDDKFRTGIGAGFYFTGQNFSGTDQYVLTFTAGPGWSFLIDRKVTLTADGKDFELGEGERSASVERSLYGKRRTGEILLFKIGRADLETVANAQKVEIRLGGRIYLLKAEHQDIFKNIIALGTP